MSNTRTHRYSLPPEQQAIGDKCFHSSGTFVEFPIEGVERLIPERFEKIVCRYPDRLAVKMGDRALTYDVILDYMTPWVFVTFETMSKTPTGKLDRRALPVPDDSRPELDNLYIAPRNPIEQELARIRAEVLGIKQVGSYDTFSDLGGHSLRAMQVISRIIMTFKVELPINIFLNSVTVAEMAVVITEHQGKKLDEKELDRVMTELESLSDDEAEKLIAEEVQGKS